MSKPEVTRRGFMRSLAAGAGWLATLPLLQACGEAAPPPAGSASSSAQTSAAASKAVLTGATSSPAAKAGGSLTVAVNGDFASFDPFNLSFINYPMTANIYDQLARYDADVKLKPFLAESWEVGNNDTSLTLKLRKGVKFHDGHEMTADDVLKNFDKARDKEQGFHMYPGTLPVKSVEAKDPSTFLINFNSVNAEMFSMIESMSMIQPSAMPDLKKKGAGTGPFKFVEWVPNDHATWEKFPDYWQKGQPLADKVTVKVFTDADAMVAALQSGTVDLVVSFPPKDSERLKGQFNIARGKTAANFYTLYVNPTQAPFEKKEVRQAMQYALDRDTVVKKVLFGVSEASFVPWPKTSPAYDPKYDTVYKYDLDKAKDLIAKAGFPNGIQATILTPTNFPELGDMCQVLQADLAKIGSKLEIKPMDPAQWYPKLNTGDYQMTFSFAGNGHKYPTRVALSTVYRLANNVFYKDNPPEAYAKAVKDAVSTLDEAKQKDAFKRMTEALLDESWAQVVAWRYTLFASNKSVKGLDWSVDDQLRLATAGK